MTDYTRLTNLEVTGDMKARSVQIGMDADDYEVTSANATAAASTAPTKAEFDAVVTLVNELKAKHNGLLGEIT